MIKVVSAIVMVFIFLVAARSLARLTKMIWEGKRAPDAPDRSLGMVFVLSLWALWFLLAYGIGLIVTTLTV